MISGVSDVLIELQDSLSNGSAWLGLQKGYTFVAEARTVEQPLMSGGWRMRLIGSLSPLPAPRTSEVNSNFQVKEIRDYYLPNPKNIIFRSVHLKCTTSGANHLPVLLLFLADC